MAPAPAAAILSTLRMNENTTRPTSPGGSCWAAARRGLPLHTCDHHAGHDNDGDRQVGKRDWRHDSALPWCNDTGRCDRVSSPPAGHGTDLENVWGRGAAADPDVYPARRSGDAVRVGRSAWSLGLTLPLYIYIRVRGGRQALGVGTMRISPPRHARSSEQGTNGETRGWTKRVWQWGRSLTNVVDN